MSGQVDAELLDDAERLVTADTDGLLRAAAMAGAQVRSTVEIAAEAGLDRLAGQRPRALVLITRPGAAAAAAPLLVALLGSSCPVPVTTCHSVPSWVSALDLVVAHTNDPGDRQLAEGLHRAGRRGAGVLLSAPADGPVAAAAAGHSVHLVPRIDVPAGLALPRALVAGLLLFEALGLLDIDTESLAEELEREAERDHPDRESLVNPAKSLALRMAGRTPLLWGTDPVATALAGHTAASLAAYAGVVAHSAGFFEAVALPALRADAVRSLGEQQLFHDPYLDPSSGPTGAVQPILLGVLDDACSAATRLAATELLDGAEWIGGEWIGGDESRTVPIGPPGAAATTAAALALRSDLAALYLGLAHRLVAGM